MGQEGEEAGGLNTPRKSQSYTGPAPLENNKATKPLLILGHYFAGRPMIACFQS